MENVEMFPHY